MSSNFKDNRCLNVLVPVQTIETIYLQNVPFSNGRIKTNGLQMQPLQRRVKNALTLAIPQVQVLSML
jgi:hypothetical protein